MQVNRLQFSIAAQAAWAPGLVTPDAWAAWAETPFHLAAGADPAVAAMPAMLRRRAGSLGKMALEVAYACLDQHREVPAVFCSRHGDVARAVDLLGELARAQPLSPTSFGLAVHNAIAGLFSIARADRANHAALAAGAATIEHGVIEACGLLAEGAPMVLLVAYDCPLPQPLAGFDEAGEQPHAFAWLMTAPQGPSIGLASAPAGGEEDSEEGGDAALPDGLQILRFHLRGAARLVRRTGLQRWTWTRHA